MIDWSRVSELRDEIGEEDFQEVIDLFLEEVESTLSGLDDSEDSDSLLEKIHFIKGSALNLGFQKLALICARYENEMTKDMFFIPDISEIATVYFTSKDGFFSENPY